MPDDARTAVAARFLTACAEADWPRALGAIDASWTTLIFERETFDGVVTALNAAAEPDLLANPRVALIAEAVGRLPGGSALVTLPVTAAQVDQAQRDGSARGLVEVAILAMVARRVTGAPEEAVAIATASRPLLRAATVTRFGPAADLAAYWHLQAAQAALHAGDLDQALRDFRYAWAFHGDDVTGYVATSTAPYLALLAALAGDDDERTRWDAEVDALSAHGRTLIEWETMERPRLVARLLDAADRLDAATGERLANDLLPQLAFDETWPVTLLAITRHLVDTGATARADQLIAATVERRTAPDRPGSLHDSFVTLARADVALGLGQAAALGRLLGGAPALPDLATTYAVLLEISSGDLAAACQLASVAENRATSPRVRREAALLRTVASGETPPGDPPPSLRRVVSLLSRADAAAGAAVRLTPTETRVLDALAETGTLPEVAARLFISRNTLKSHLRGLYAKLGVSSREEAVALGGRLGLLENDEGPPP